MLQRWRDSFKTIQTRLKNVDFLDKIGLQIFMSIWGSLFTITASMTEVVNAILVLMSLQVIAEYYSDKFEMASVR